MPSENQPSSNPPPPQPQAQSQLPDQTEQDRRRLVHNLSITLVLACPAIALLPPRKFDWRTIGLAGVWFWSGNNLSREYTGRGVLSHLNPVQYAPSMTGLPTERAREYQAKAREEKEKAARALAANEEGEEGKGRRRGVLTRFWMGDEKKDWKERRLREEQEALDEGKGYGDLIMEQIREVWGGGKKAEESEPDGDGGNKTQGREN